MKAGGCLFFFFFPGAVFGRVSSSRERKVLMPGRGQVSLSESDSLLLSFALFSSIRRLNENPNNSPQAALPDL